MCSDPFIVPLDPLLEGMWGVRRRKASHLQEQCIADPQGFWGGHIIWRMMRRTKNVIWPWSLLDKNIARPCMVVGRREVKIPFG